MCDPRFSCPHSALLPEPSRTFPRQQTCAVIPRRSWSPLLPRAQPEAGGRASSSPRVALLCRPTPFGLRFLPEREKPAAPGTAAKRLLRAFTCPMEAQQHIIIHPLYMNINIHAHIHYRRIPTNNKRSPRSAFSHASICGITSAQRVDPARSAIHLDSRFGFDGSARRQGHSPVDRRLVSVQIEHRPLAPPAKCLRQRAVCRDNRQQPPNEHQCHYKRMT